MVQPKRVRLTLRKQVRELYTVCTRTLRTLSHMQTLANDDDRRSLLGRVSRLPEGSIALAMNGEITSPLELLDRMERALATGIALERVKRPRRVPEMKLRLARMVGRLCDRGSQDEMRNGYRRVDAQLRSYGL